MDLKGADGSLPKKSREAMKCSVVLDEPWMLWFLRGGSVLG